MVECLKKPRRMKNLKRSVLGFLLATLLVPVFAHINPNQGKIGGTSYKATLRDDCAQSRSSTDMDINNVRARLLGGGDVWWDLSNGRYIVPKVDPASGQVEVSAIFAGSVWLGGFAPGENLKVAAQTYRQSGNDYWPGPLDESTGGTTNDTICLNWDRHFEVIGDEIDEARRFYTLNRDPATGRIDPADRDKLPDNVLYWPALGNPWFEEKFDFSLPDNQFGALADFWDQDKDGIYDPLAGDYPRIGIRKCEDDPRYPDQMIFWIYNDAGGPHTQTNSPEQLRMEVQVQAFAYATNDEVNDMTFQRYRLINRGTQPLDSTYFAMWTDPDLGCSVDDYIGCDTAAALMYVYNEDALDGFPNCNCSGGFPTYCDKVPILGIDYFRGPLDLNDIIGYDTIFFEGEPIPQPIYRELGMSSFTYYNRGGGGDAGNWPEPMTDPDNFREYYRFMSGSWKDGTRFTKGGSGYNVLSNDITNYVFPEAPNDAAGWSMCTADLDFGDRRTIQASGPFELKPGAINELIIGVVFVPDEDYPCPSLDRLLFADGIAQALFDNCFAITDGPDAPNMDWIELDEQIIAVLSNEPDTLITNNAFEAYQDLDLRAPTNLPEEERLYKFEGYKIYQLVNANVSLSELDDPEKAKLAYQVDIQNGVGRIYNWASTKFAGIDDAVWLPTLEVNGEDKGIRHTFRMTEDLFAQTSDNGLINHRDYYYTVVAYSYNNFADFDFSVEPPVGQRTAYLEGRNNVRVYKVTPRPITDVVFNSGYGDGFAVTRLDGQGAGGNFLDLEDDMYELILSGSFDGRLRYEGGMAPINVKVFNPFAVRDGRYRLLMNDPAVDPKGVLSGSASWILEYMDDAGNTVISTPDIGLSKVNEQVFREYGISITLGQTPFAGARIDARNGLIGGQLEYATPSDQNWYGALIDGTFVNFIPTDDVEQDYFFEQDPDQAFSSVAGGTWYPYVLCAYQVDPDETIPLITPAWVSNSNSQVTQNKRNALDSLNNVDIVFTPDRSKWSRCIVVETASDVYKNYSDPNIPDLPIEGNASHMKLRAHNALELMPDANGDPVYDPDTIGLGWFPGYAIDVETGQRLNIFYGENSVFYPEVINDLFPGANFTIGANGRDMIWNPSDEDILQGDITIPLTNIYGGQHTIYVTRDPYDGCINYWDRLQKPGITGLPITTLRQVTWTSIPILTPESFLTSWAEGLIPNQLVTKLRVDRSFAIAKGTEENNRLPAYEWTIEGNEAYPVQPPGYPELLAAIDVVPNPYYGLSYYEANEFATTVKITNLPAVATVSIYTLDGKFIRRFNRNEMGISQLDRTNAAVGTTQIIPNLEWDLKNDKGIPVASGIYLIHIEVPGVGVRTLKWFGVQRQFDPSKL